MNGISIITVTQDHDEQALDHLMSAFMRTNTYSPVEWIILDHSNSSRVGDIVSKYVSDIFIRYINLAGEFNQAKSRNLAMRKSRYNFLLLLHKSVNYTDDLLQNAVDGFNDPEIGAIGVRLIKMEEKLHDCNSMETSFSGITFKWDKNKHYFRPQLLRCIDAETGGSPDNKPGETINQSTVPALSGEFLLLRRADYNALGGFEERYKDEFDEIDFCIRLKSKLGKNCLCINDRCLRYSYQTKNFNGKDANNLHRKNELIFKDRTSKIIKELINTDSSTPFIWHNLVTRNELSVPRILFVMHGPIDSNSGYHAQGIARQLRRIGIECVFALPSLPANHKGDIDDITVQSFNEIYTYGPAFSDGMSPDIIHAWTPREIIRKFCEKISKQYQTKLVIHFEDNEKYLTETATGKSWQELINMAPEELDNIIPLNRFHPLKGPAWLSQNANGITMIIETLSQFNTNRLPSILLPPLVDERLFYPRPLNRDLRDELKIPNDHIVLVYTGNVHTANKDEVEILYNSVELLNNSGCPVTLIRTGHDSVNLPAEHRIKSHIINMGWVNRRKLPEIMAAADIFIQPGDPGPFNDQRLPSKLPEYFSIGRPVILPKTNIGLFLVHKQNAYILDRADLAGITNAVRKLKIDPGLCQRLALGSVAFFRSHWNSMMHVSALSNFYSDIQKQTNVMLN